jgi:protein phosphatase PTC7
VASIGTDGFLRVINLGDSVLMVIRDDKILVKTKERIHYFDCPYQLSNGSPDRPRDATSLQVELLPGDIIIAGSDGVFDNLTESTVRKIVTGVTTAKVNLGLIAKKIVDQSRSVSLDPQAKTPYALMAKQNRYEAYESGLGGKVDDISCVVARCT